MLPAACRERVPGSIIAPTHCVRKRSGRQAVLLEGEGEDLDTYYYLLQDLYSVTGLIQKNGALVEANTYDTYGRVSPWSYHPCDVWLLDGAVTAADNGYFRTKLNGSGNPTADPSTDFDMDGDTDDDDQTTMIAAIGQPSGVEIYTSGVGNPYFFTGRRLHFLETLHDGSPTDTETNWQVQYNRRRHYDPRHGRWLQRDPAGYADGMNLYEYVRSNPIRYVDGAGLSADLAAPNPASLGNWTGTLQSPQWYWSSSMVAEFAPSFTVKQDGKCTEIRAVQIARTKMDTEGLLGIRDEWSWHLDVGTPWYPASNAWRSSHPSFPMDVRDEPGYPSREFNGGSHGFPSLIRQEFETCAVCSSGSYKCKYKILSCFR